jgi:prepilin-type processing-associated H-X9-DG protein
MLSILLPVGRQTLSLERSDCDALSRRLSPGSWPFPCVNYGSASAPDYRNLRDSPVGELSDWISERMILSEDGMWGWQGPDARNWDGSPGTAAQKAARNHEHGYNAVYFDGHAKIIPYGRKWRTLPAMGWPPNEAPQ